MLLGRIIGTLVAVTLMALYPSEDTVGRVVLILVFSLIGVGVGIWASIWLGPAISNARPRNQDSEKYWIDRYGQEMGKEAYRLYLKSLQ